MYSKKISIIIVNWNGEKWLKNCLESLYKQTYTNFEIIIVDNNSKDGSVDFLKNNYPQITLIEEAENWGFAKGNNLALPYAKGEYLLLLNNDTVHEPDYLEKFVKGFSELPDNVASIQSKMVLMFDRTKLDVCGAYWSDSSFLYHYGYGKDSTLDIYNTSKPFFSNKGASMLIKKKVVEELGLFDDDFWCYYEETDFCHRLWIAGYECWYYPESVMYHAMGGSSLLQKNELIQFHNFKNKLLSFLKNFQVQTLLYIIPIYIILNILISLLWLLKGKHRHSLIIYKAFYWNILHIKETFKKRKKIQKFRKVSDAYIHKKVKKNPSLNYYLKLFTEKLEDYNDKK